AGGGHNCLSLCRYLERRSYGISRRVWPDASDLRRAEGTVHPGIRPWRVQLSRLPGKDAGGNTSCVRLTGPDGCVVVLDAGTGIRTLARELPQGLTRIDVLLTHVHMDHILGLGFFGPLYDPRLEVHIWGPASATLSLEARLRRYLSPPFGRRD